MFWLSVRLQHATATCLVYFLTFYLSLRYYQFALAAIVGYETAIVNEFSRTMCGDGSLLTASSNVRLTPLTYSLFFAQDTCLVSSKEKYIISKTHYRTYFRAASHPASVCFSEPHVQALPRSPPDLNLYSRCCIESIICASYGDMSNAGHVGVVSCLCSSHRRSPRATCN